MYLPFKIIDAWVSESKKQLDPVFCNVGEVIEGAKVLKDTAATSGSMFLIGSYSVKGSMESMRGKKAFCKVAFRIPDDEKDFSSSSEEDSSEYEVMIHSYLANLERRTPNITKFFQSFVCPKFFKNYQPIPKYGGGYYSEAELLFGSFGYLDSQALRNMVDDFRSYRLDWVIPKTSDLRVRLDNALKEYKIMSKEIEKLKTQGVTDDQLGCLYALLQKVVDRVDHYDSEVDKEYVKKIQPIVEHDSEINSLQARFLIIEAIDGIKLADYVIDDSNYESLVDIMFQIFYTIREMRLYGVRHNDLHTSNIMLEDSQVPTVYFVDRHRYYVSRGYRAKLLDFDRATLTENGQENRSARKLCKPYGQCAFPSERADIYVVIKSMRILVSDKDKAVRLIEFFEKIVDKQLLDMESKDTIGIDGINYFSPWNNRVCVKVKERCSTTEDIKGVKTFDEMLQEGLFNLSHSFVDKAKNIPGIEKRNIYVSSVAL